MAPEDLRETSMAGVDNISQYFHSVNDIFLFWFNAFKYACISTPKRKPYLEDLCTLRSGMTFRQNGINATSTTNKLLPTRNWILKLWTGKSWCATSQNKIFSIRVSGFRLHQLCVQLEKASVLQLDRHRAQTWIMNSQEIKTFQYHIHFPCWAVLWRCIESKHSLQRKLSKENLFVDCVLIYYETSRTCSRLCKMITFICSLFEPPTENNFVLRSHINSKYRNVLYFRIF